jgi:Zn-dependent peptidase ImmA (M78 family)
VLRWARESIGYGVAEAAHRIGIPERKLAAVEQGSERLTLRQAERAADLYDRPLVELLLPEPPAETPIESQFRRLPDAPAPPWAPDLVKLIRQVHFLQDEAADVYGLLDEPPAWAEAIARLEGEPRSRVARAARQLLGVDLAEQLRWAGSDAYRPLREWVDAVERLGVHVMQSGVVPVETMRGLAVPHDTVPVILLNTKDAARARAFTILHEFGHLVLRARNEQLGSRAEAWCNDFAGEVVMPGEAVMDEFEQARSRRSVTEVADQVGSHFSVTTLAAAVRLRRLELLTQDELDEVRLALSRRPVPPQSSGGDHYVSAIARRGPAFVRMVLAALDNGVVSYPHASTLLDVRASNLHKLRDRIDRRTATG